MLTDPGCIEKVRGGMAKMTDGEEKVCAAMLDASTSQKDRAALQVGINLISAAHMQLSECIPPEVM